MTSLFNASHLESPEKMNHEYEQLRYVSSHNEDSRRLLYADS